MLAMLATRRQSVKSLTHCGQRYWPSGSRRSARSTECRTYAWFPPFRCRSSVAVCFAVAVSRRRRIAVAVSVHRCSCRCASFCCSHSWNGTEVFLRNFYRTTEFYKSRTATEERQRNDVRALLAWGLLHCPLPQIQRSHRLQQIQSSLAHAC